MRIKKIAFIILFAILISATSMVSFSAYSNDVIKTWQDDLDESAKGNLTVQQYDVKGLYFASQGTGTSAQNRITNEKMWENESIIFDKERIVSSPYYVDSRTKQKLIGVDPNVLFYNNRSYFGDESKQSLKAWGYYVPSKSGYYKFKMESDDGSYLSIFRNSNNLNDLIGKEEVLVNDMSISSYNSNESKSVYLEAKKPYPILIKYFNWGGDGLFTFSSTYSESNKWNSSNNYSPVNQNDLYPSKKTQFFLTHGNTQYLKDIQVTANAKLDSLASTTSVDIEKLRNLLTKSNVMVNEYYNYTQEDMNKLYEDIRLAILQIGDSLVEVKKPYPDDFLINQNGKLMVQKYKASDINSAYEGGNSTSIYNDNKSRWTNESFIFSVDRRDGLPKLYTAEIVKKTLNAAVEEVFFYDGGGNYGYSAKEIREGWGYFVPNKTGYYQFESSFDDGIRSYLFLDKTNLKYKLSEATILSSYYNIGVFSRTSDSILLEAGKPYPIYINHFNWHGPNKLALKYRFATAKNSVSGSYVDVPSSWFYASDKDDFFEEHGDVTNLKAKNVNLNILLNNGSLNLTEENKSKIRELIAKADLIISKYYNYTQVEIDNFIKEIDNLTNNLNYNTKIKRYIQGNRSYLEITEPFNENSLDPEILTPSYSTNYSYVNNGKLAVRDSPWLYVTENLSGYDYIEMTIDQLYAGDNYASIGVPYLYSSGYWYLELADFEIKDGKDKSKLDMFKKIKFDSNSKEEFTTKLIAIKKPSGKYNITVNVYERGNVTESGLLVSDNNLDMSDDDNRYILDRLYISMLQAKGNENTISYVDNLKVLAYKELAPFAADIKNFKADTNGNFIKLTWDTPNVSFDSYIIKELIDGVLVNEYSNIVSSSNEYLVDLSKSLNYSDRTFEIYAKKNVSYSTKKETTWKGGVNFLSITNFKASTSGQNISLKWDSLDSKLIDKYVIKEITSGVEVVLSSNVDKSTTTFTLPIDETLSSRTFIIEAFRGTEKTKPAQAGWIDYLSTLRITNFKATTNAENIELTWDKNLGDFEKFIITEVVNGVSKTYDVDKSLSTKEIPIGNLVGDRTFTIVAVRGILKSASATALWKDDLSSIVINNLKASSNRNKIVLSWDSVVGNFDKLVISQTLNGVTLSKDLLKDSLGTEFDLGDNTDLRTFVIYAVSGSRKSASAQTVWQLSQNSMTINQISGYTGKKLGTLVYEDSINKIIIADANVLGYSIEDSNVNSITFTIASSPQVLNVIYLKTNGSNVSESTWKAEALESINRYATSKKIDFYENSFYETKYKTDTPENTAKIKSLLLNDFKRILANAGAIDLRDGNLEKYKAALLVSSGYPTLESLQAMIDKINGPISTINKDTKGDEYLDLLNNTKVTSHDFEFGLATEINITKGPIYNPTFEFELQGNEFLTYQNPKVALYDSNKKRISSKAIIEYDSNSFKYVVQIVPTSLTGNKLENGKYYVNLDTKTLVNTEKYSISQIIAKNENKNINIKKTWEFSYYISDIVIANKKITEGLSSTMKINFTETEDKQSEMISVFAEKIKFELNNAKTLPGGF